MALLGSRVENAGTIITTKGTTGLAAGDGVTLGFDPNGLMAIKVNKGAYQAQVANSGVIEADGGMVVMTAQAADELLGSVVNTNGIVRAQTLATGEKGQIILLGGMTSGTVLVGGTLDASAPNGGDGGFVETSAAHVKVADGAKITTSAPLGKSGTWLIDPVDFTIAPTGGDMTGTALTAALSPATGGDVFIQSSAGDVNVNDEVEWSANKLTLHAYNTININAKLHGSGIATLALEYGQGSVDGEINGVTADYYIKAPVDLPAGPHFSTKLGANAAKYFTVITALGSPGSLPGEDLQGLKPDENYALGGDIDAVATVTWLGGAGFQPIAGGTDGFHGVFDGLGHTIKKLTIKPPDEMNIGLFSIIAGGGVVRNIGLVDATVKRTSELEGESDTLGILAGINAGTIYNSYATGTADGLNNVGGLVGKNTGHVTFSHAEVAVTGSSTQGGLVGYNFGSGEISRSYASGNVGGSGDVWTVGGLVGLNEGKITESYATGNVTGTQIVGGLVGENGNASTITNTYSSGPVSGEFYAGGLAGMNSGTLANSFYDKSVNTTIPGVGDGTLDAVGAVEGKLTGDLKRLSTYTAWNSTIDANYNADAVWRIYEKNSMPLLRGLMTGLTLTDTTLTYNGGTQSGAVTAVSGVWGTDAVASGRNAGSYYNNFYSTQQGYDIRGGNLTITKAPLTITAFPNTKVYDGSVTASVPPTVAGIKGVDTVTGLAEVYDGKNAATDKTLSVSAYTINDDNFGNNYSVTTVTNSNGVITKAPLTITAVTDSRQYNGTITSSGTPIITTGTIFSTDSLSGLSQSFASKNALGTGGSTLAVVPSYTLNDGNSGGNYNVTLTSVNGTITKAPLTITAVTNTKVYDGSVTASAMPTVAGVQTGDTISGLSEAYSDKNAATDKTLTVSAYTINDGNFGNNYSVTTVANSVGVITKAPLTITEETAGVISTVPLTVAKEQIPDPAGSPLPVVMFSAFPATPPRLITLRDVPSLTGGFIDVKPLVITAAEARMLIYQVPQDTFIHSNPEAIIQLTVRMADGSPLPAWMSFDPINKEVSCNPPKGIKGEFHVIVMAKDQYSGKAQTELKILVGT